MKKVNFNKLKNIKTPENWIDNAIKIPQTNKKPIPFYRKPYAIASAACLVVCCAIGFLILNSFGTSNVIPTVEFSTSESSTQTDKQTGENSGTTSTTASSSQNTSTQQNTSSQGNTSNQQNSSNQQNTDILNPPHTNSNNNNSSVQHPSVPKETVPKETVQATTKKPDYTEDEIEYISSGQYEPTLPPMPPTETPTESPTKNPSSDGDGDADPDDEEPDSFNSYKYFNGTISFVIKDNSVFSSSQKVYCHLSTSSHGDKTYKYSPKELCTQNGNTFTFSLKNTFYRYSYNQTEYTITFYDNNGNKCSKTIRLGDKNKVIYEM